MARFLSEEWFKAVDRTAGAAAAGAAAAAADLVLEHVVTGTPEGDIRYEVHVGPSGGWVQPGSTTPGPAPRVTIASDYATAVAVASGHLSTQAALLAGRFCIGGSVAALAERQSDLVGLDLIPESVRADTTY
jgi:hypothetical protein